MQILSAADLDRIFTFPDLIAALAAAFRAGVVSPVRHHHPISLPGEPEAMLLLMPAWDDFGQRGTSRGHIGVKIVTVFPGNSRRGKGSVAGAYLLFSGETGEPLALLDGQRLTTWRTAAASALAATYLARPDAARLVMAGAGALAPFLIAAHRSVRPITEVLIWNHNPARAEALAAELAGRTDGQGCSFRPIQDLEEAVHDADIISCATLSREPVVRGAWLKPGAHLDLVGAFTPAMRESDNDAVRRARIFVDTRAGALNEAGDIVQPIRDGIIDTARVEGDLFDLCRGEAAGRAGPEEITLFKSVGTALEDLAAAGLAMRSKAAPG